MLIGFGLPVSGSWATPDAIVRVARLAEELGYASLWTFQRVLGDESVLDPLVTLAHVAGHTDRIRLGTATICAPFIAPALLAKSLSSLDVLSGGRLDVGLGMGWKREEYAAAGVPFERRGARMDEYLRCLHALWTQDPVEFAGEFYTVPRSRQQPRPVQQPHPPVLLGGAAAPALRRAGRLAQGWIASSKHALGDLPSAIDTVRAAAQQAPRIVVRRTHLDDIETLRALGVTEVILDLNFTPGVDLQIGRARAQAASTFGMMSSFRRLRSSSVLATGTSANGGHRSGIDSPASL